jgi:hypothetical protein
MSHPPKEAVSQSGFSPTHSLSGLPGLFDQQEFSLIVGNFPHRLDE